MILLGLPAQTYMCSRKASPAGRLIRNNQDDTQAEPPILQIATSRLPTPGHTEMLRCVKQVFQQHVPGTSCHRSLDDVAKYYHGQLREAACSVFKKKKKKKMKEERSREKMGLFYAE